MSLTTSSQHLVPKARGLDVALLMPEVHAWAMERPTLVAAGLARGMTAVDLGCGDGSTTRFLAGEVGREGRVIGLDADSEAIARASERSGRSAVPVQFHTASAYVTELEDSSVDFVLARHVFSALGRPEDALAEIHRILKPGGTFCALDPHDGLLWIEPTPAGHTEFMERAAEEQALVGGDRAVGQRLPTLAETTGFEAVHHDVMVFDSGALGAPLFTALALKPVADSLGQSHAAAAEQHVHACLAALEWPQGHGSAGFYVTTGRKA